MRLVISIATITLALLLAAPVQALGHGAGATGKVNKANWMVRFFLEGAKMNKKDFGQVPTDILAELKRVLGCILHEGVGTEDASNYFGPSGLDHHEFECDQCKNAIGQLRLASLTIKYGAWEFCCETCLEEWLDARQEKEQEQCP